MHPNAPNFVTHATLHPKQLFEPKPTFVYFATKAIWKKAQKCATIFKTCIQRKFVAICTHFLKTILHLNFASFFFTQKHILNPNQLIAHVFHLKQLFAAILKHII